MVRLRIDLTNDIEKLRKSLLSSSNISNDRFLNYKVSNNAIWMDSFTRDDFIEICHQFLYEGKKLAIRPSPTNSSENSYSHKDNTLYIKKDKHDLADCLSKVRRNANDAINSYGTNILYFAIGFLELEEKRLSPIALMPVKLKNSSPDEYSLEWTGEDALTSRALQDQINGELPKFPPHHLSERGSDEYRRELEKYFEDIEAAVADNKWKMHHSIALDNFSNKTYHLHKDLNPADWGEQMREHPVLQELYSRIPGEKPKKSEDTKPLYETYQVFADDYSHIEAISAVSSGRNILIDGGPGNGKSQTIVGMITELMGQKKKILFVSEKQPAIDVVYSRLEKDLGLKDFCLVLHSDKLKKGDIYDDIISSWRTASNFENYVPSGMEDIYKKYDSLKSEMNLYANELSKIRCERNLTTYDLFGLHEISRAYFTNKNEKSVDIVFEHPETWTTDEWVEATSALEELGSVLNRNTSSVWKGCNAENLSNQDLRNIEKQICNSMNFLDELTNDISRICRRCYLKPSVDTMSIDDIQDLIIPGMDIFKGYASFNDVDLSDMETYIRSGDWKSIIEETIPKLKELEKLNERILTRFNESIFDLDLADIDRFSGHNRVQRSLDPSYKEFINKIRSALLSSAVNLPDDALFSRLELLGEYRGIKDYLESEDELSDHLGSYWKGVNSDVSQIENFTLWAKRFQDVLQEKKIFSEDVFDRLDDIRGIDSTEKVSENVNILLQKISNLFDDLGTDTNSVFGKDINDVGLKELEGKLDSWKSNFESLSNNAALTAMMEKCSSTVAKAMLPYVIDGQMTSEDLIPTFEFNYTSNILKDVPKEIITTAEMYETKRDDFIALENQILRSNSLKLAKELSQNIESSFQSRAGVGTPEDIIRSKAQSVRKLMKNAGGLVQSIKPCFMMSPDSVAKYLPQDVLFDVVIFDEASQLKTADAMGSILRGKQLVVCGDINQMPPSNYFETMIDNSASASDEVVSLTNVQSILELASSKMENRTLDWHYRSRHESLIAVPNDFVYKNRFYVHPSPKFNVENLGLDFVHCKNSYYYSASDKNENIKEATNPEEAKRVVRDAFDYHIHNPDKTIGIATIGRKQMDVIQKEIDTLIQENPDERAFFNDHHKFFLKNLENVQGDERDAVFLSICYGYRSDGKFVNKFGPINYEGGEKKLNVFVTRAKEKCSIYANFTSDDIVITETTNEGVKFLKLVMEYAESKRIKSSCEPIISDPSKLRDHICDLIRSHGYSTIQNYGVGRYSLDIVVEDPIKKGQFMAAILLDGPQFYNTLNTRDRVRTHHEVLSHMGWNLFYVLSADWHHNHKENENKLIDFLKEISEQEASEAEQQLSPEIDPVQSKADILTPETSNEAIHSLTDTYMDEEQSDDRISEDKSSGTEGNIVSDRLVCSACGKQIEFQGQLKFCPYCGEKLYI